MRRLVHSHYAARAAWFDERSDRSAVRAAPALVLFGAWFGAKL